MDGIIPFSQLRKKANLVNGKVPISELPESGIPTDAGSVTYYGSTSYPANTIGSEVKSQSSTLASHTDSITQQSEQIVTLQQCGLTVVNGELNMTYEEA